MRTGRALVVLPALLATVEGHASLVVPRPRNAVDHDLPPWNGPAPNSSAWDHHVDTPICPIAAGDGTMDGLSLRNGQACYWFSHGCTIQCVSATTTRCHTRWPPPTHEAGCLVAG
jgi:hypothetical protein